MQVKSDVNCKLSIIKVEVSKEGHPMFSRKGVIIDTNGKSIRMGRLYKVRFEDQSTAEFDARELKELKPPT